MKIVEATGFGGL